MVWSLQAQNVTLGDLRQCFGLELTENEQFFQEWQADLTEVTTAEKQRLDRVKSSFSNLLEYAPLLENTVKMVVLSPLLDLADVYQTCIWHDYQREEFPICKAGSTNYT